MQGRTRLEDLRDAASRPCADHDDATQKTAGEQEQARTSVQGTNTTPLARSSQLTTRLLSALVLQWKDRKPSNVRAPSLSTSALVRVINSDFAPAIFATKRSVKLSLPRYMALRTHQLCMHRIRFNFCGGGGGTWERVRLTPGRASGT